ncbi:UDP-4-amino-4,6-dideoxy-N-acetyl-beta-L-altrosamine transaminase, partial [archaeon]|nr:UDP-4-amino-4,6-dideoxy-N-acetyl-beta-L-altrosamine transaminase [archaeon]
IAVDYAGQPCNYTLLREISDRYNLYLVADACHALGAKYSDRPVGSLADLNVFSFHPVKHITTGEGGMITTGDQRLAERMQIFRNHGITTDHHYRETKVSWLYEMIDLGYNYRITDFQCALGISQLRKLTDWLNRRREIAARYDDFFSRSSVIAPLRVKPEAYHSYHLYVVRLNTGTAVDRASIFKELRSRGVGVNVHYIPVHLHPYYRDRFGTGKGLCPAAEAAYEHILSLPIYPAMSDDDIQFVIESLQDVVEHFQQ